MKTPNEIDEYMNAKMIRLSRKYPVMCLEYLVEMHKAIDWAEKELKKVIK